MEKKFEPFEKVLIRAYGSKVWICDFFSNYYKLDGVEWVTCISDLYPCNQCEIIPYEGNEHLLGTTDAYKEPYEPKDGDFVVSQRPVEESFVRKAFIFRDNRLYCDNDSCCDCYCGLFPAGNLYIGKGDGWSSKPLRPATEEEKQELLDALHNEGKDWDAEKKEIVDYKWRPKEEDDYYRPTIVDAKFVPYMGMWTDMRFEIINYEKGWVFQTEEECQALCDKLNEAIKNVK